MQKKSRKVNSTLDVKNLPNPSQFKTGKATFRKQSSEDSFTEDSLSEFKSEVEVQTPELELTFNEKLKKKLHDLRNECHEVCHYTGLNKKKLMTAYN